MRNMIYWSLDFLLSCGYIRHLKYFQPWIGFLLFLQYTIGYEKLEWAMVRSIINLILQRCGVYILDCARTSGIIIIKKKSANRKPNQEWFRSKIRKKRNPTNRIPEKENQQRVIFYFRVYVSSSKVSEIASVVASLRFSLQLGSCKCSWINVPSSRHGSHASYGISYPGSHGTPTSK